MAKYSHDTIVPFKNSDLGKKEQVARMFDRIAFRYDFLNRFLSGGIDMYWRRKAIRKLAAQNPQTILDVATGTADMAILLTKYLSAAKVTGIDISEGMLALGRQKIARAHLTDRVELRSGDSEAIHYPDNSFDAITVAFGVRNFENLEKGLREMLRVLRPGGTLVVLEFSQPKARGLKQLYHLYMRMVAPEVCKILSSNREAYKYLSESVQAFPEGDAFVRILDQTGYTHTTRQPLSMGICTVYTGTKILL